MIQDAVKDTFDKVRGVTSEDILSPFGLSRKRSPLEVILPAAGIFVAGVAVGVGIGLLTAPKSGREMRRDLKGKAAQLGAHFDLSDKKLAQDVHQALANSGKKPVTPMALEYGSPTDHHSSNRLPLSHT